MADTSNQIEDYEPLGAEWKAEMMKWNKTHLIGFLAKRIREQNELRDAVKLYIEQPSLDSMEAMKAIANK